MNCLHILPMNKLSGAEKLALILCKNMNKYNPIVVCGGDNLKSVFEKENIESYSVDFFNNNILKNAKGLKKIIKEKNIKIIHAHDNNASINAYITKLLYRLDIVVISHIHNCYPWLEGSSKTKKIDKFFRKRYDYNIACGSLVYDYYSKHTDYINENNTVSLPNAIDVEDIKNYINNDLSNMYEEFKIDKRKKVLGFIGRLSEQKGIIPFIKELSKHKDKFNDCHFLLVGSGEQEEEVKELIKLLDMEELFILTGYQDNIYKFYPIIDVFFLPSLYEGLPMVILEAMSFEKSIVSMNVGSINEVIKNNKNGILINKDDYEEFINKLYFIKENEEISKDYGKKASKYIKDNYDIKEYSKKVEELYNKLNK